MRFSKILFWAAVYAAVFFIGYAQGKYQGNFFNKLFSPKSKTTILTDLNILDNGLSNNTKLSLLKESDFEKLKTVVLQTPGPHLILTSKAHADQLKTEGLLLPIEDQRVEKLISPDFQDIQNILVSYLWTFNRENSQLEILSLAIPTSTPDIEVSRNVIKMLFSKPIYLNILKETVYSSTLVESERSNIPIEKRPEYLRNYQLFPIGK